jgi:hypothetical protein
LSHAYGFDPSTQQAFYGHPDEPDWKWDAIPESAQAVAKAFAIYHEKLDPGFVNLPVRVRNVATK